LNESESTEAAVTFVPSETIALDEPPLTKITFDSSQGTMTINATYPISTKNLNTSMLNMLLKRLSENNQLMLNNNSLSGQFYVNSDVLKMLFRSEADVANENSVSCADWVAMNGRETSGVQLDSQSIDIFDSQNADYFTELLDNFDMLSGIDNNLADNASSLNVRGEIANPQAVNYGAKYVNEYSQTNIEQAMETKAKCQELCCLLNLADNAYGDLF